MTSGVYALLDSNNTVRYVGQSKHIEKRFREHKKTKLWPVKWLWLHISSSVEERLKAEREWVCIFGGFLENKTKGGEPAKDEALPATRQLLADSARSYWDNPEWRKAQMARIGAGIRTVPKDERSAIAVNRWKNPQTAQTITESLKRRGATPEYKEKKRQDSLRIFADPAVREKLRAAQQKRWTPEERERASRYMKIRMSDPMEKARCITAMLASPRSLGYRHTDEVKAKIGAAAKGNQWNVGKTLSLETRQKISAAQKGKQKHRRTV